MSSLSKFAQDVVSKVFNKAYSRDTTGKVEYKIEVSSSRHDAEVLGSSFKLKKPLPEETINAAIPEFINILSTHLAAKRLGVLSAILVKAGISPDSIGKSKKESGSIPIVGSLPSDSSTVEDNPNSIRTKTGRFMGKEAFKVTVDLLMKPYIIQSMTAPALVYRTGRFVAGTRISYVNVISNPTGNRPILFIGFDYQKYPYETFDPEGPNGRGLATYSRNPRKIIGDAITKVLDDLISDRHYEIRISQL